MWDALAYTLRIAVVIHQAAAVAWRRPSYSPVSWLLSAVTVADLIRMALRREVWGPVVDAWVPGTPPPVLTGWVLASRHVDSALIMLTAPAIVAVAAAVYLQGRSQRVMFWCAFFAWVLLVLASVLGYPTVRGAVLATILSWETVVGSALALWMGAMWTRRREVPGAEHVAILVIALVELSHLAGAYLVPAEAFERWGLAQVVSFIEWTVLVLLQGVSLWWYRSRWR